MTKLSVIRCLLSVMLVIYLALSLFIANDMAARQLCAGINIHVEPAPAARNFVTVSEVKRLLDDWKIDCADKPFSAIDLQSIENRLNGIDNIERANVYIRTDGALQIDVIPMVPVARVFDKTGSYYINRDGKRITANARFRIDVPVVTGHFNDEYQPKMLLPLIDYLGSDSAWNAIVAQIMVEPKHHDVILVPMIRGHVINLGDTANIKNKLDRILTMYRKVMPLKGWEYYDTLSVKWGGQVVASRRHKTIPEPYILFDQAGEETEEASVDNMLIGDSVAKEVLGGVKNTKKKK